MRAVAIALVLAGCRPTTPAVAPPIGNRDGVDARAVPHLVARDPSSTQPMIAQPRAAFLTAAAPPPSGSCEEQLWSAWREGLEHLAVVAAALGRPGQPCAAVAEHAIAAVAVVVTRNDRGDVDGAWRRGLAWSIAAKLASTPARARVARRNLAEAGWDRAWRSHDDSVAWVEAAEAFAALTRGGDADAPAAEAAAWINAVVTELRTSGGDPDRAVLAHALARARALPPDLAARIRAVAGAPPPRRPLATSAVP